MLEGGKHSRPGKTLAALATGQMKTILNLRPNRLAPRAIVRLHDKMNALLGRGYGYVLVCTVTSF